MKKSTCCNAQAIPSGSKHVCHKCGLICNFYNRNTNKIKAVDFLKFISQEEKQKIEYCLAAGEEIGYGNLIAHLKTA